MAEAIDTAPDNEIGTQVRNTQTDNFTKTGILVFPRRQSDSGDRTNVRSAINGLNILFSAGNYMRLGGQLNFSPEKLYRTTSFIS
jgi:hypothetical protein